MPTDSRLYEKVKTNIINATHIYVYEGGIYYLIFGDSNDISIDLANKEIIISEMGTFEGEYDEESIRKFSIDDSFQTKNKIYSALQKNEFTVIDDCEV